MFPGNKGYLESHQLISLIASYFPTIIAARKRSSGQGNMFTGVCLSKWGCHPSMHCSQHPNTPCSRSPGPHLRGKWRRIWSRPTAKGEVEGDLVQAHSQGGNWGESAWGVPSPRGVPGPGGCLVLGVPGPGGAWSRGCLIWGVPGPGRVPALGGCLLWEGAWWRPSQTTTATGGTHPTGVQFC